jgi:transposase-like protein
MPENDRLDGCLNDIESGFVKREATPRVLMTLGIQLHLASLSLSNTVSILEIFGVSRARSTIHNWVHKAELQPEAGRSPDHVAVNETVTRLQRRAVLAVCRCRSRNTRILHKTLDPTINKGIAHAFFAEPR